MSRLLPPPVSHGHGLVSRDGRAPVTTAETLTDALSAHLRELPSAPVAAGRFADHCEGYFACDAPGYLLGVSLKIGLVKCGLACPGSTLLDEINAFDMAEVAGANMGQLNVITVSSFCGPQGRIWGYDLCAPEEGHTRIGAVQRGDQRADLYDLASLTGAFERLMGTLDDERFPFMPGSHVPAAMKMKTAREPGVLYAAMALGVPEDRSRDACLMMENPGFLPGDVAWEDSREAVLEAMAHSALAVGENQRVRYREIFVGATAVTVKPGEAACAMALAPYFRLAQNAVVRDRDMTRLTLAEWELATRDRAAARQPARAPV